MNRTLAIKLGTIALLMVLLMLPLSMIDGLINERQAQREQVVREIARSSSYSQTITGPLLVVPYHKKVREWKVDPKTQERFLVENEVGGRLYFLPEIFELAGDVKTELRARGIYEARLYHADSQIKGHFELPMQLVYCNK